MTNVILILFRLFLVLFSSTIFLKKLKYCDKFPPPPKYNNKFFFEFFFLLN